MLYLPTPSSFSSVVEDNTSGWFRFGAVSDPVSVVVSVAKSGRVTDSYVSIPAADGDPLHATYVGLPLAA